MITALSSTQAGDTTIVTATSNLTPPVYFFWYQDGIYIGSGAARSRTFITSGPAQIDVLDSTDPTFDGPGNAPAAWPATRTIAFVRSLDAGTARYRIEQQQNGGSWTVLGFVDADPARWLYSFATGRLDDLASYVWRVIPISAAGDDGTALALSAEAIVRTPDAPDFTIDYLPDVYTPAVLASSPLVWYRLGDTSGSNAHDSSGNAHTGAYNGGFTLNQVGAIGDGDGAVLLNGSSGFISGPNLNAAVFSIEAWIFPTVANNYAIASEPFDFSNSNLPFYLFVDGSGNTVLGFRVAGTPTNLTYAAAPTISTWTHVVGTYDGANLKLYFNGAIVKTQSATGNPSSSTSTIAIGHAADFSLWFTGVIDDVSIYAHALTGAEVTAHYNAGLTNARKVEFLTA